MSNVHVKKGDKVVVHFWQGQVQDWSGIAGIPERRTRLGGRRKHRKASHQAKPGEP